VLDVVADGEVAGADDDAVDTVGDDVGTEDAVPGPVPPSPDR
jgi:hypothetical protein